MITHDTFYKDSTFFNISSIVRLFLLHFVKTVFAHQLHVGPTEFLITLEIIPRGTNRASRSISQSLNL